MKKLAVILTGIMTVSLLGGCGSSFDAAAYTQALLDNSYKNDSSKFVSLKVGTAEQASELYDEGIDMQLEALLAGVDATEAQEAAYREVVEDILAGARYTVGEAEKQDDGSYIVTVTYETMNIFRPAMDDYLDKTNDQYDIWMESGEELSEEEAMKWAVDTLKDCLADALANATYDEPDETTIEIELIDRVYTPNSSDLETLSNALFDN